MSIQVPPLKYRMATGQTSPLTAQDHDYNLRTLANSVDAASHLFGVTLGADGTLKDDAIYVPSQLADRVVTKPKLHWLANMYATATSTDGLSYTATIEPNPTVSADPCAGGIVLGMTDYGDGNETSFSAPIKFAMTNTGPVTLSINGLAAAPVKNMGSSDLEPGNIRAGVIYELSYDGAAFQITSQTSGVTTRINGDPDPSDPGYDPDDPTNGGWGDCPSPGSALTVPHSISRIPDVCKVLLRPKKGVADQNGWKEGDVVDGLTNLFIWVSAAPSDPPDWQHHAVSLRFTTSSVVATFHVDTTTAASQFIVAKDGSIGNFLQKGNSEFDYTKWQAKLELVWI